MSVPEHLQRFWRGLDALFGRVRPTPWGAVVTDGRYPAIWDANYARIDAPASEPSLRSVAEALTPALRDVDAETFHVVTFDPERTTGLMASLSSVGHRIAWDVAMGLPATAPLPERDPAVDVRELEPDAALWERVDESIGLFGVEDADAVDQLRRIEQDVLAPGGKRWFGVRDAGRIVSLAALILRDGVGYIDNVATFPQARGRGYASAVTAAIVAEARGSGAMHVDLLADPDDRAVVRMYERLGFVEIGRLASTKGPVLDIG